MIPNGNKIDYDELREKLLFPEIAFDEIATEIYQSNVVKQNEDVVTKSFKPAKRKRLMEAQKRLMEEY